MAENPRFILITGASGFLGAEVFRQLTDAGFPLIIIRHRASTAENVITRTADISEFTQLESVFQDYPIQIIIHMAATLSTNSNQNPDLAFRVNVLGSNNLLECAQKYHVSRFVYASSFSMIGYRPLPECPVNEELVPTPCNYYGETKRFVEMMGMSYARKFGFEFAAGRMGAVVGPGKSLSTSPWRMDIFNMLKTGGTILTKFAPQVRLPISGVEDTARALVTLATALRVGHQIYNLPNDSLSIQDIADMVSKLRADAVFSFGTSTDVDMPPLIDTSRFTQEFSHFEHLPLSAALLKYQRS